MQLTSQDPNNPTNNFRVIRSQLRSQFVREFIGEREFEDISVLQLATGVNLNRLTRWRGVNWILGKALGFFQWSFVGIFNFAVRWITKIVNFDWSQGYQDINDTIKQNNLLITGQLGQLLGGGLGWTASIALAGLATIKFPVIGARVGLQLAEEGGQALRNQMGSFLENVAEALLDNIVLTVYSGYRRIYDFFAQQNGTPTDWESAEPWVISKEIEKGVEKIDNDYVKTFVQNFGDGFLDAILDVGYVVSFTIDDHFLATQAAVDMMETSNEPVRRIEVFPDADNEEESIILEDSQNNVELSLNNYLSTHEVIRNRDVGVVVGQTYDEWYSLKPQSRKLIIEFRGKEKPPFLNTDGTLSQRVQISIPNVKPGVGWSQLKAIKKFTWGNFMARGVFSDRRQMTVWGSSEAEAKSTLLDLAKLSASDLVQLSVSHPEIQNIKRKKAPTLVFPAYATLLVRRTTIGANDTTLIDGQNKAMARMRVELWKDDPQIIGKAFYKYNGSNPYTITTMKIIAPFKFWLKAVEIFFLQIPCFLLSVYFAGIASMFLSAMHGELTLLDKIIFFSIFIFTNTLLFANYCDWGKSSNKEQKRFLPSQAGLIEGLKMTFVALIANYFISLLLSLLLPESYLNQLEDSGIKFHFSLRGAIILSTLWLYVASYLLYCISLLRFIKK